MLVLSRKKDEKIVIGDQITLMVIDIRGDKVRLGIQAPKDVTVHRQEVYEAIQKEMEMENAPSNELKDSSVG
ncbi:MAG: carbon storage regulator CsrA [Planctomycetaceae bacterium]|jgi:carbon storage regulator|nr:carbon storage regulator CsrA [bacterium]MDC0273434.1 carbon storage regulator CsrA [Planctomycetaceae bacterium]MDC0308524.1 carbon storage regulator CsrA [Planctomycetaceae bacterium]MDG2388275.1 carbon storage regulator CsrA [Planctomycetaceae bacterium]